MCFLCCLLFSSSSTQDQSIPNGCVFLGEALLQSTTHGLRHKAGDIAHPIIRNLVFMGMGEPLLNLRETTRALEMLNHDKGMDFSPRRITVSTCGINVRFMPAI